MLWFLSTNQPFRLISNELTPWSRVLLEKLIAPQLVKKFSDLSGIQTFIAVFVRSHHWTPILS